jgi:hypothetical protein
VDKSHKIGKIRKMRWDKKMPQKNTQKPNYYLNEAGEFIIENYNSAKPFSNFFPGIAGKYGIPMWVFYVNRGQAITSFGTRDKNHAILEFYPANRAWQFTPLLGFRTFIKLFKGKNYVFYEPFQNGLACPNFKLTNSMSIMAHELRLRERNSTLGLETCVEYFTVPQDSYAALVRLITIKNTGSSLKKLQLLDGLPQIVPFGTANLFLKKLSRTVEAWMKVKNLKNHAAFYKLDVDPTDRPEVIHIKEGNFYLGFHYKNGRAQIIKPIVDPQAIFGQVTDFATPRNFLAEKYFTYPKAQATESKTPSGFLLLDLELKPREEKQIYALAGYARSLEELNRLTDRIIKPGYIPKKQSQNREVIEELQQNITTKSAQPAFNLYAKQTYLDNIIRGGYPVIFKTESENSVFYLYSRKHGDPERDYNKFHIEATYFSQGNGNFRDTNQNRRCDLWFNPEIREENVVYFFSLLQADGFNPLVVKGMRFALKDGLRLDKEIAGLIAAKHIPNLISFLKHPFTPGNLLLFMEENNIGLKVNHDKFLGIILSHCTKIHEAEHGEGFWTDHWSYNLDLLEQYLAVYPGKIKEILFEKNVFTFYDNAETVKPRAEKYVLNNNRVMQLSSVFSDPEKREILKARTKQPHALRMDYGRGEIYHTTLVNKLLCVLANKLASFDPSGVGIEMEADKPNWFDSLNGLPALFGSSLCETFELKRLALFLKKNLRYLGKEKISVTEEVGDFLRDLDNCIREYLTLQSSDKDYRYWDKTYSLKEDYRKKVRLGLSGNERVISIADLTNLLNDVLKKTDIAILKARQGKKEVYSSYFFHEVTKYYSASPPFVKPLAFKQHKLPLFLEGQMHALRLAEDSQQAKKIYRDTKKSALFDTGLKMYKVTAALSEMPEEIGRCRVFTPGWLENESIWLHMEYKYLLEMLKSGLYEEFYADFKNILVCFQDPAVYGRNILENSSFLVSSVFPDKTLRGNGFVARLSGSTAEFLHIWRIMHIGLKPFFLDAKNELNLRLAPLLCGWLFNKNGDYGFNFLSKILVTYHNPERKNTFGKNAASVKKIVLCDENKRTVNLASDVIPPPYAQRIRARQICKIDLFLD